MDVKETNGTLKARSSIGIRLMGWAVMLFMTAICADFIVDHIQNDGRNALGVQEPVKYLVAIVCLLFFSGTLVLVATHSWVRLDGEWVVWRNYVPFWYGRVRVSEVVDAEPGYGGLYLTLKDGSTRSLLAGAVWNLQGWLGVRSRAHDFADELLARAGRGRCADYPQEYFWQKVRRLMRGEKLPKNPGSDSRPNDEVIGSGGPYEGSEDASSR